MGISGFDQARRLEAIEGRLDPVMLSCAIALAAIGVVMVASTSISIAPGAGVSPFHYLFKHLQFLALGCFAAVVLVGLPLRDVERQNRILLLGVFALLLGVFLPGLGYSVNGAQRWLNLGVTRFQAVEAVKPMLIVWLASYLARHRDAVRSTWRGVFKPLAISAGVVVLLLAQPDFGSAVLICVVIGGMLYLGGAWLRALFLPALIAVPLMVIAAMSASYRVRRLTSFMNPWEDPFKDGFQLTQALIAIGRGEGFGVGLGGSVQKLFYLPEAHTDFIFAVLAEELGFAGVMLTLLLFGLLVGRMFRLGLRAMEIRRTFAAMIAFGVALWLALQAGVSIGVNLGVLPTKGLTLPLISSGGSSLIATLAAIGLVLRVSLEVDRANRQIALRRESLPVDELFEDDAQASETVRPRRVGLLGWRRRRRGPSSVPPEGDSVPLPLPLPTAARQAAGLGRTEPTLGMYATQGGELARDAEPAPRSHRPLFGGQPARRRAASDSVKRHQRREPQLDLLS